MLVAWLQVFADSLHRSGWEGVSRTTHVAAALLLHASAGTLLAAFLGICFSAYRAMEERVGALAPRAAPWLAPVFGSMVAVLSAWSTAFWTFSGERIRSTTAGQLGPWIFLLFSAVAGGVLTVGMRSFASRLVLGSLGRAVAVGVALLFVAASIARVDLTVYVSLYSRLHTLLEIAAAATCLAGTLLLLRALGPRSRVVARIATSLAAAGGAALFLFSVFGSLRVWVDETLRHAWREPVYVGRMLSRMQITEGFVRDPRGWRGATMSSVARLRERYDIATIARSPIWDQPLAEPPWLRERLAQIRGTGEYNVVVFYIDTLRADMAREKTMMPNLVRFAGESLDFRRAYTTGSDTLHALPGIIGGTYDLFADQPNDLLRVAKGAGYESALFVAQSANEFLEKLLPQFRFDQTVLIPDYSPGNENVWGYGADQPTAARMVDRALDWLRAKTDKDRFFLWMFNFDVHNWRELDEAYVRQAGRQYHLLDESDPIWRYRVAASSVDAQFGRLLDGLRELGRDDDTLVVVLSDHGEALGHEGFWVHSVFLWESLVHVPLLLRVPGVPPASVGEVVSLIDVAPTLARSIARNAETTGYQGEDLLSYIVPGRPKRRLPLVMMSTLKEVPIRLGLIDPGAALKLVLPLEGAVPELYDLRARDADALDLSGERPADMLRLLNELVRAPLFPRPSDGGTNGPLDQAAREGRTAIDRGADLP